MSVYVDPLFEWGGSKSFKWKWSCHLIADSRAELVAFARQLGLQDSWIQDVDNCLHYDLTENKRRQAVRLGAKEVSFKEFVRLAHENSKR